MRKRFRSDFNHWRKIGFIMNTRSLSQADSSAELPNMNISASSH